MQRKKLLAIIFFLVIKNHFDFVLPGFIFYFFFITTLKQAIASHSLQSLSRKVNFTQISAVISQHSSGDGLGKINPSVTGCTMLNIDPPLFHTISLGLL
jgi:hypothetical protein